MKKSPGWTSILKSAQDLSIQVSDFSFSFWVEQDHKALALWSVLVEISGIEPLTSWMPFKRSPSWAVPLTSILALEKFLFSTHFTEIYILIRWSRWGPLVTRLPSHQKNAPLIYYMIPKIHCVWCDHVRFGLVVFSNHTAIITRRAMMAAKFLNFEAYGNTYVDRQKQNLHNKESF